MKRLTGIVAAAVALLLASGSQAAQLHSSADSALAAANALMAQPWTGSSGSKGLAAQYTRQTLDSIAALNGKRITNLTGGGWHFDVHLKNMTGAMDIGSPPGLKNAAAGGFALAAPLNSGGWSVGISGVAHAEGSACCTPAGQKWFSVKGDAPFNLLISKLRLTASVQLNPADPSRPTLTSAHVAATARVGGSGWFPGVPVVLAATISNGAILLGGNVVDASFSWGGVHAQLTIRVQLKILPSQEQLEAQIGKTLDLSAAVQNSVLSVIGKLKVRLPDPVGSKSGSLALDVPIQFPSSRSLNDALEVAAPPIPRQWPPPAAADRADGHAKPTTASTTDFAAARDALEAGIAAHMPNGTVLSVDTAADTGQQTYGLENDSMIWSGHYLAAEAFRFAATSSPDALARIRTLLDGIKRNFDVTTDGVVVDGRLTPVSSAYRGVFARTSLPDTSALGYTDGALNSRAGACYYERPAKGWRAGNGTTYSALALAFARVPRTAKLTPVGPVTYGFGCGSRGEKDHPISRDQYLGLFMGLGYAYALIPDVRDQVRALLDPALDFLLRNNWNVPLPPSGQIVTTFIGDFDAQLALLRIGATVDPGRFGGAYAAVAPAAGLTWIPIWFSTIDPTIAYFKFNLGHAAMGPAAFLETDPALKAGYLASYRMLAAPTLSHRNAYFNLVDVLIGASGASSASASTAGMTVGAEIKSDLADWLTRWSAVRGANGMPRNATSALSAQYLARLWTSPQGVTSNTDTNGHQGWLANFVVPLWARPGNGMDFVWQRSPFGAGVDGPASSRTATEPRTRVPIRCAATPPSVTQVQLCSAEPTREGPGIDYLLPYWLARYLRILEG